MIDEDSRLALPLTLAEFPIGCRLLVRGKDDWRVAAVSRRIDEIVVLTVASPSGRSYRLRRMRETAVMLHGNCHAIVSDRTDTWHDNLTRYDIRW